MPDRDSCVLGDKFPLANSIIHENVSTILRGVQRPEAQRNKSGIAMHSDLDAAPVTLMTHETYCYCMMLWLRRMNVSSESKRDRTLWKRQEAEQSALTSGPL